jgi:Ran GTPase-activating protein (RanGAP) involved in mRNA processing and transport
MSGAYTAACTAAGGRTLASVSAAYSSGSSELLLNGHRTIELIDDRLKDLDIAPLAVALEDANPFSAVDLSYNTLGHGAAESIRKLVASDSTITALDLSENDFTEAAAEAICAGLKSNTAVRELRLSGNKLRNAGGMAVAGMLQGNSTLQRLHLSNCELDTQSLVALATVLRDNQTLSVLDVSRPLAKNIMDEHTQHFARMLKVNTTLVELDLSKSGMRDLGLQLIAEELFRAGPSSQLQVLRTCGNKIELVSEECVAALRMLLSSPTCRLSSLHLGFNSLRDEGALKLAEVVQSSATLQHLDVASNAISSRGLCALARAVSQHVALKETQLWGNRFDSAACLAWISSLQYLKLDIAVQEVDGTYNCVRCL